MEDIRTKVKDYNGLISDNFEIEEFFKTPYYLNLEQGFKITLLKAIDEDRYKIWIKKVEEDLTNFKPMGSLQFELDQNEPRIDRFLNQNRAKQINLIRLEVWKQEFNFKIRQIESNKERILEIKRELAHLSYLDKQIQPLSFNEIEYYEHKPSEPSIDDKFLYLEYLLNLAELDLDLTTESLAEKELTLSNIPIDLDQKVRFVYLAELQIIEFLKNKIKETGQSYSDKKLYTLLSLCCGISEATAKKLMGFYNYKDNIDRNNPFKDKDLMEHVSRYLTNNNLKL